MLLSIRVLSRRPLPGILAFMASGCLEARLLVVTVQPRRNIQPRQSLNPTGQQQNDQDENHQALLRRWGRNPSSRCAAI
jgi:hypothetical protein